MRVKNEIPIEYYYYESVKETPYILENILKSEIQNKYREYMSNYRNISKKVLDEAYMFYILDEAYLQDIIYSMNVREMLGIQVGYTVRQQERFVFPILNFDNVILGFIGYDYEETDYKYLISLAKFAEKGRLFFNYQNINEAYRKDVIILEEGVFDSLRLNEIGYKNNLALMGTRMSDFHKTVLNRFKLVIIISDNDESGKRASNEWFNSLDTKVALVTIKKREINRTFKKGDDIEEREIVIKDIDDFLNYKSNWEVFKKLYNKILEDSHGVFFSKEKYFI